MKKHVLLKTLIAGDSAVGKTTLIHRYVEEEFIDTKVITIGVDFFLKEVKVNGDTSAHLQIWDIGGQQRFRYMVKEYIPGARGALLLFDTTSWKSFVNIDKWAQLLRIYDKNLPIVLVATKYDLKEFSMVADYYAELKQKKLSMIDYIKTSSKTGHNVNEVFEILARYLVD
ncbi:MAG: GTP-binding protein [Promethearchaeota archaeon]|nr:MAG: GTP-binding protein [Candidatus Lokiarchaeota archaeon]